MAEEQKGRSTHAIVPLHTPKLSKARLSKALSKDERAKLTLAMLDHVLSVLQRARTISTVTVVSADRDVRPEVEKRSARFIWERRTRGLNSAITFAQRNLGPKSPSSILIIHADLPTLAPRDVDSFVRAARNYQIVIAPSKDGAGTNALYFQKPNLISTVFGPRSFHKHLKLIRKKSLRHKIVRLSGIGFDLDSSYDLKRLIQARASNDVSRFIRKLYKQRDKSR